MRKATFLIGAAAGYVLGTRAGRERYEQIRRAANSLWENPVVQQRVGEAEDLAAGTAKSKGSELQSKLADTAKSFASTAKQKASGITGHSGGTTTDSSTAGTTTSEHPITTEPVATDALTSETLSGEPPLTTEPVVVEPYDRVIEVTDPEAQAGSDGRLS